MVDRIEPTYFVNGVRVSEAAYNAYNHSGLKWLDPQVASSIAQIDQIVEDAKVPRPETPAAGGKKDDADKPEMGLIDPEFLEGTARVLTFGAKKYDRYNWAKGISYHRVYSALQRHLNAFWRGEDADPETGQHHLFHASCCVMFLAAYEHNKERYKKFDDRPKQQ